MATAAPEIDDIKKVVKLAIARGAQNEAVSATRATGTRARYKAGHEGLLEVAELLGVNVTSEQTKGKKKAEKTGAPAAVRTPPAGRTAAKAASTQRKVSPARTAVKPIPKGTPRPKAPKKPVGRAKRA